MEIVSATVPEREFELNGRRDAVNPSARHRLHRRNPDVRSKPWRGEMCVVQVLYRRGEGLELWCGEVGQIDDAAVGDEDAAVGRRDGEGIRAGVLVGGRQGKRGASRRGPEALFVVEKGKGRGRVKHHPTEDLV